VIVDHAELGASQGPEGTDESRSKCEPEQAQTDHAESLGQPIVP
jgi:hypothetical protein